RSSGGRLRACPLFSGESSQRFFARAHNRKNIEETPHFKELAYVANNSTEHQTRPFALGAVGRNQECTKGSAGEIKHGSEIDQDAPLARVNKRIELRHNLVRIGAVDTARQRNYANFAAAGL